MLSVRTSRSSLVKGIHVRAAVRFHMTKIGVFGQLLFLVGHVDQYIEAVTFRITIDDRQELLFVQLQKLLNGHTELIQETVVFLTAQTPRRSRSFVPWHIVTHRSVPRLR